MSQPEYVYEIFIRSTPQRVWDAITRPEFTRQYWGGNANLSDWQPGSGWRHVEEEDGKTTVYVTGQVVESVPPRRLVLTWVNADDAQDASRVTLEIEAVEEMVRLRVVHGDFTPGSEMPQRISWGWPRVCSSLKSFLETNRGLNVWAGHHT